jgi:hypothetical protein
MATARKRIGGHKSSYTKLKKKYEEAVALANDRAGHMKKAKLIIRSPR